MINFTLILGIFWVNRHQLGKKTFQTSLPQSEMVWVVSELDEEMSWDENGP